MEVQTDSLGKRIRAYIKGHWVNMLISFLLALFVWGLVLAYQNPNRVKTVSGVSASFEGEADLIARRLVLVGIRASILPEIAVSVNTDLNNYSSLNKNNITATVSLRSVVGEGTYELLVTATSNVGEVISVSPSKVTVTVDRLSTKKIPVEVLVEGSQNENYWYSAPAMSKSEIEVEGAYSVLSDIANAKATVNIEDKVENFSNSCTLTLCDRNGTTIQPAMLYGEVPSVTVSYEIYPKKEVSLALSSSLIGQSTIPTDYEIYAMFTVPATVTIICKDDSLDLEKIASLALNSWDITGKSENLTKELEIIVPDGLEVLSGISTVTAYVNIREKIISETFSNIPVRMTNQKGNLRYTLTKNTIDVTITGSISVVSEIKDEDIIITVDVSELALGESMYTVPLKMTIDDKSIMREITYKLEPDAVSISVQER